ncbi:MAG: 16S rRNA (uracil(1498)-N(3))-methyltransferase [Phycisphaerales bacterium]|nr:16S rRNA (uracil(1498)-N(3))-methyltransferase [Phycisphaerales bacterium]
MTTSALITPPTPFTLWFMYRFYLPGLTCQPPTRLELPDDQAHHALSVLRLTANTPVILFDGQGHHAPALITSTSKRSLLLELTATITTDPPPSPALTIAVAVPKADRADWLIEQASQLNVTRIQWLTTDRTIVKPREGGGKLEKHHRLAIESAKQCHRTHLLQISAPITLDALLSSATQAQGLQSLDFPSSPPKILWLDPALDSAPIHQIRSSICHSLLSLIGPEGGWSPHEQTLLHSLAATGKLLRVRLTPTILRIETAATALAAIVMC